MSKKSMLAIGAILCGLATVNAGELTITDVSHVLRPNEAGGVQISGVTYAGGDMYYAVDDADNNMYPLTLAIDRSDGSLMSSNITIGTGVLMSGGKDMEGCAYDPCSGNVWVSDESGAYIREYDPATGSIVRAAPVPAIQKKYSENYSLEALTISGDGLTMWTSNEEALTVDGDLASATAGSVVRLTRFKRESVRDNWTPDGEWAYVTEALGNERDEYRRCGVSGLCALPDGTLLALERHCKRIDFTTKIYQVDFAGATDVSSLSSLKDASYTAAKKTELWKISQLILNIEGICLGPRLQDGSCVLVLVADGGKAMRSVLTLKLSGLNIRTMNFEGPESGIGAPSIVGNNYRFIDGARLDVALSGVEYASAYTNNAAVCTNVAWQCGGASGSGSRASFTVSEDATFSWNLTQGEAVSSPIDFAENFEGYEEGSLVKNGAVGCWAGDGEIGAGHGGATFADSPMPRDSHEKVLKIDSAASCDFPCTTNGNDMVEMMVSAERCSAGAAVDVPADALCALKCDENGIMRLKCGNEWIALSDKVYNNGDWLRVSIKLATNNKGKVFMLPRIDGEACKTAAGVHSPFAPRSPGAWYPVMQSKSRIAGLEVQGGVELDDVIKTVAGYEPEIPEGTTAIDGVPLEFLRIAGGGLDPQSPAAQPRLRSLGYTVGDVYRAGLDPAKDEPLLSIGMRFLEDRRLELRFNGIDRTRRSYGVYRMSTLGGEETPVSGSVEVDEENYTTTWTSDDPVDNDNGFYVNRVGNTAN